MLPGTDIRGNLELARYADRLGVDSLWVYETRLATDALVPLAVYALVAERVRLGTGSIPMWTRNPALIAQSFATLDLLAPGRVILGLGAWWEPLATRVGVSRTRPVTAMREVVEAVRLLLSLEEHVTYQGEYVHLEDVYLDHGAASSHDVKIYIAAVGPQMLRLAGQIAGRGRFELPAYRGVHTQGCTGGQGRGGIGGAHPRRRRPGAASDRQGGARQEAGPRRGQALSGPVHIPAASHRGANREGPTEMGPELARRLKEVIPWPATPQQVREGARLIPDELIESLDCYGDEDQVRSRLKEYKDAGVNMPIVSVASRVDVDVLARGS